MQLGSSGDLTLALAYAFRYVMLNFPAGVVPVTRVRPEEELRLDPHDTIEQRCRERVAALCSRFPLYSEQRALQPA